MLRQRIAAVQTEITALINSLKAVGGSGAALLQTELDRLQEEQSGLRRGLRDLTAEGAPLAAAMRKARAFVDNWSSVAQILDAAEADELRLLLQHFVEVIEGNEVALEDVPSSSSFRAQQLNSLSEAVKSLPPEMQQVVMPFMIDLMDLPRKKEVV